MYLGDNWQFAEAKPVNRLQDEITAPQLAQPEGLESSYCRLHECQKSSRPPLVQHVSLHTQAALNPRYHAAWKHACRTSAIASFTLFPRPRNCIPLRMVTVARGAGKCSHRFSRVYFTYPRSRYPLPRTRYIISGRQL